MSEFILMLTRNDVTVSNAADLLDRVVVSDLRHVGFKDIGLPRHEMQQLVDTMHANDLKVHLEVVSLSEEDELRSASVACELGVDFLIGGTRIDQVSAALSGAGIKYFPYIGTVVGHPGRLEGSIDDIAAQAGAAEGRVDGINLLAFRHRGVDSLQLLKSVVTATSLPVICAGDIASTQRIREVVDAGAWAFTVGGAVLDRKITDGDILAQVETALQAAKA
jgi:NAD(P)H-dependent flavin oxidoreductase YrpB (nitropropane dioxygenase family)